MGKTLPVASSWTVPNMDQGDTWKATVDIDLPADKSYYHVSVYGTVTPPDAKLNPYVFNDIIGEVWLVVQDSSGYTTAHYDEKVYGDDLIPQPGPFRTKRAATAGDEIAAYRAAATDSTEITFAPVYYNKFNQLWATVGAEVKARYISQSDERGYVVTKTVASSGEVTFPCPEDSYTYIVAKVSIPTTDEVWPDFWIGGGDEFDEHDCGKTGTLYSMSHYYLPWKNLNEAIPLIEDHFDTYRKRVTWTAEFTEDSASSSYKKSKDKITFRWPSFYSLCTAGHEFGHALHHISLGSIWSTSNCNPHYYDKPSSYSCAMSEGFADYAGSVGAGVPAAWENTHYTDEDEPPGKIEGNIAALFTDLIDSTNEGDDETTYSAYYVVNVMRTCRVSVLSRINDVSDFVWCLENRVDDDVHEANFPGIITPYDPVEVATEPDDWDADDIRDTWLQNVGN